LGLWGPIIKGMIEELADKVDSMLPDIAGASVHQRQGQVRHLSVPGGESAPHRLADDDHPICPLYVCRDGEAEKMLSKTDEGKDFYQTPLAKRPAKLVQLNLRRFDELKERAEQYRDLWKRDPYLWDITPAA
jgi:hypothetical protein